MDEATPGRRQTKALEGIVVEALPSALYRVEVEGRHRVTAHVGGGGQQNFVRLLLGDRVLVELTEKDVTRARIVRKLL
jgi:translation initiation factor IF-1